MAVEITVSPDLVARFKIFATKLHELSHLFDNKQWSSGVLLRPKYIDIGYDKLTGVVNINVATYPTAQGHDLAVHGSNWTLHHASFALLPKSPNSVVSIDDNVETDMVLEVLRMRPLGTRNFSR